MSAFATAGHTAILLVGVPSVPAGTPFGALALDPFVQAGTGTLAGNGQLAFTLPVPA